MTVPASSPVQRSAPGRIWYVVGLVVFLAGMAGMGVFLVDKLTGMADALTRVIVPGEAAMPLQPGKYTIFHERQSVVDGRIFDSPGLGGLAVSVTGPDGTAVMLAPATVSGRYSFGSHIGFAAFDFTATTAGDYTVAGRYPDGATGPETVLAVGSGFMGSLFGTIFGALGIAFGGAAIAAVIIVTTLVRRRRAGHRL
jgi:hypothetical protein